MPNKRSSSLAGNLLRALGRLRSDLSDPLLRNAYALMINALGTSALGLIYWILAARFYGPTLVGASSALISALLLASTMAQLNLGGTLARFLPRAGEDSRRLVLIAYTVSGVFAVLIAVVAMPWIGRLADAVGLGLPGRGVWLVIAVATWCAFALQDHILTGLREAIWVPVENAAFGILKIVLLVGLAATLPEMGILASWVLPMVLLLFPVNILIFGRLLPLHMRNTTKAGDMGARNVGRFVAFDYVGSLFHLASMQLLPVLVATFISAEANGYFYVAWVVMITVDMALVGVTSSLPVEGSHAQERLPELARSLIPRLLAGAGSLAVAILIGAPYVLAVFGSEYSANATDLLRLLALGLLPRAVVVLWVSMARVQNRVREIVAVQAAVSVLVLGLSALLMPHFNIAGAGIAYSIGQAAVAVALLPRLRGVIGPLRQALARSGQAESPRSPERVSARDVSVVIPVRNAEPLIEQCLDSVVRAEPAEIIVVDGNSTDSTRAIASRYPVSIVSDDGLGLPVARTLGAEAASSKWVVLIDVDMVLGEGDLDALLGEFVDGGYVGLQAGLSSASGKDYWGRALANHHRFGFSRRWLGLMFTVFERDRLLDLGFDRDFISGEDVDVRLRLKDLGARTGVSRSTVAVHRFEDGFGFAKKQWAADGAGLARVVRKRGPRSSWILGLPLASAVWGVLVSMARLQPQWIPYFLCYLVGNYVAMFKQLVRPAKRPLVPVLKDLSRRY